MTGNELQTAGSDVERTVGDLRAALGSADLARHLALFYEDVDTQHEVAAAFVVQGLRSNHRCLYLADANAVDTVRRALAAHGIDVDAREAAGDLRVEDAGEVYLDSGFDPDGMIRALADCCEDALADGYDGLWIAGENTWCFHTDVDFDHVVDFEADFDCECPDLPVTALCQYDVARFAEQSIAKALWTHEQVVYRHTVCENPYYVPPERFRESSSRAANARLMLEQLHEIATVKRDVRRREQRLSVVTRVLRHNIRNDMNAARGYLDLAADHDLPPDASDAVDVARGYVDDVVETAAKARYVQQTLAATHVEEVDLDTVLADAVDAVTGDHASAVVSAEGDTDATVLADATFDDALAELLENAVEHQDSDQPVVTVTVDAADANTVTVDVTDPGDPIPETDRRALEDGRETQVTHASGLGLWLAKWAVENAAGSLELPDDGDDYTVRLRLVRVRE